MRKTIFAVLAIIAAAAPLAAAKPLPPGDSVFVKLALPAAALNSIIKTAIAKDPVFAVPEPDKPVLTASGNSLSVANMEYGGQNGFQPQLRLTPFLAAGNNTAGIRIEKFSLNGETVSGACVRKNAKPAGFQLRPGRRHRIPPVSAANSFTLCRADNTAQVRRAERYS